ncbi:MAG: D-glycero-beta-D-manno-heptose-7-phosphate kinase [Candidatus Ratteibacteria bacterium]|nr:D-glycero-beta-D-manno-heptose-7-phosphate kinase [Candidatus Ratteibacteria bacterium]
MKKTHLSRYSAVKISNGTSRINNGKLFETIKNFKKASVLVIGDLMLDEFLFGKIERISPEAPVPVVKIKNGERKLSLGGAANVAYNIKTLGGKAFLAGVIGNDLQGKELLKLMEKSDMDTSGIITENKRPTTHKLRAIVHWQQVIRLDRETNEEISSFSNKKITDYIKKCIPKVNYVVISDYDKGLLTKKLLSETLNIFKKSKIPVLVDPTLKNMQYYRNAYLIKPNLKEALQILAKTGDMSKTKIVHELKERLLCENVLLTCGEEGMILLENNQASHIPSLGKEIHDVTGAGDTVIATVALALSAGASLKEAAVLSNFAAGIVVGKPGTSAVTCKELTETIKH